MALLPALAWPRAAMMAALTKAIAAYLVQSIYQVLNYLKRLRMGAGEGEG